MKIAFFGKYGSFGHYNIGGTDSIVRRLSYGLVSKGHEVNFITFGAQNKEDLLGENGIPVSNFKFLNDAFKAIAGRYDHIITIYLPAKYRLPYLIFRWNKRKSTRFHYIFQAWPESSFKRQLMFAESRLAPYNGFLLCISPRLYRHVSRWAKNSVLLLPPVPKNYFITPEKKPKSGRLRLTYMGRLDPGKGVSVAIRLFRYLAKEAPEIQTRICGYPWKHNTETMRLHEKLINQDTIIYEPTTYEGYSQAVDNNVGHVLRETDILFLPYDKLSSTIDMPLLLLEGMSQLCAVVTRPLGDLPEIYGTDQWMLQDLSNPEVCFRLIRRLAERLDEERDRLYNQCEKLKFRTNEIVQELDSLLREF